MKGARSILTVAFFVISSAAMLQSYVSTYVDSEEIINR